MVSYCPDRFLQNRAYVLNYGVTGVKLLTRSFYSPARRQNWLTPKGAAGQEKPVPPVPERSQGTKTLTPESFTFFCLGQQPTQAAYACPGQPSTLPARRPHSQGRPRTSLEDYSWNIKAGLDWNLGAMLTYRRPRQRNASEQRNTGSQLSSTTFSKPHSFHHGNLSLPFQTQLDSRPAPAQKPKSNMTKTTH